MNDIAYSCWAVTDTWGRTTLYQGRQGVLWLIGAGPGEGLPRRGRRNGYSWYYIGAMTDSEAGEWQRRNCNYDGVGPRDRYL